MPKSTPGSGSSSTILSGTRVSDFVSFGMLALCSSIKQSQPNRRLVRCGPFKPMLPMRWDVDEIAGFQLAGFTFNRQCARHNCPTASNKVKVRGPSSQISLPLTVAAFPGGTGSAPSEMPLLGSPASSYEHRPRIRLPGSSRPLGSDRFGCGATILGPSDLP